MKWFRTFWLNSKEREILRKAEQPVAVADTSTSTYLEMGGKPYKNLFYSNKNLTVVFKDGTVVSKSNVEQETFNAVKNASTQREIDNLMIDKSSYVAPVSAYSTKIELPHERDLIAKNLDALKNHPYFDVRGNQVYLKGVNLAMPVPVISSFIELVEKARSAMSGGANRNVVEDFEEQIEALRMFWLKLALNTLPQSREDLLSFITMNDVKITRNGNLILYRRIVTKAGADTQLVTFVTQSYYKLKKGGFDPRQFAVYTDSPGSYNLVDLNLYDPATASFKPFCNLQQMYLELPTYDSNTFTAAHDPSMEIKIGGIYKIPDNKINLNNGICAAGGLHAACVSYNYSGFGDMPVVVLVNPSKAITVPTGDTGKLRTTEMFVACVNDKDAGVHFDESALAAFDSEYHDFTLSELEEAAKAKSFEKLSVQDTVPAVSLVDLNTIRQILKSRVKAI